MTKTTRIVTWVCGIFLLLIAVAIIILATFDWNRLKPTINQKVSAELNRPFAIRGDLGVVWERQKEETGWRSWVPWPHVHADDIILGNPPDIPDITMVHLPRVEATLAPLALLTKTVYLPWIKLQQPDARLIRLSEKITTGRSISPAVVTARLMLSRRPGLFVWITFCSIVGGSSLMTR
jgi:uncharacterized protein involved in outer membrane biogenesis